MIGYAGKVNSLPYLLGGLERLKYRGYGSSGLAVLGEASFSHEVGRIDVQAQGDNWLSDSFPNYGNRSHQLPTDGVVNSSSPIMS